MPARPPGPPPASSLDWVDRVHECLRRERAQQESLRLDCAAVLFDLTGRAVPGCPTCHFPDRSTEAVRAMVKAWHDKMTSLEVGAPGPAPRAVFPVHENET